MGGVVGVLVGIAVAVGVRGSRVAVAEAVGVAIAVAVGFRVEVGITVEVDDATCPSEGGAPVSEASPTSWVADTAEEASGRTPSLRGRNASPPQARTMMAAASMPNARLVLIMKPATTPPIGMLAVPHHTAVIGSCQITGMSARIIARLREFPA